MIERPSGGLSARNPGIGVNMLYNMLYRRTTVGPLGPFPFSTHAFELDVLIL